MSRSWNRELPAVVWLVVLAAVVSWPALALDGLVGHERCTAGCHAWVVWAAGQRLAGALPGDLLFFPHGADLVRLYGSDFVSPALLGLLGGMSSPARALDLWVVFLFASNGLAALVLARGMGLGRCPGAVVGTAYMAAPFFLHEAFNGTTELLAAAPLPLFALAWLRLLEKPSWRLGLLAGLAFGIGGLLSAYTPFFLLLLVAVSLAWWGVSHIEPLLERARVRAVALAGVVGAGVLLPVVLLHAAHGGGALHGRRVGWSAESVPLPDSAADLLGLFTARLASPPRVILQGDGTYYDYWTLGMVTIGFLVLGLALLGWWRGRPRGPWPALLVVALVVSFGPYLVAGGQVVRVAGSPVPLPALLFERLLPLWGVVSLHPYRFATLTTLALAVLAGRGVAVLAGWFEARARWMPVVLAVVVCAGVAAEGLSTRPGGWALPPPSPPNPRAGPGWPSSPGVAWCWCPSSPTRSGMSATACRSRRSTVSPGRTGPCTSEPIRRLWPCTAITPWWLPSRRLAVVPCRGPVSQRMAFAACATQASATWCSTVLASTATSASATASRSATIPTPSKPGSATGRASRCRMMARWPCLGCEAWLGPQ